MSLIKWNEVTWYSKIVAVIVYVGTFFLAFHLGAVYEAALYAGTRVEWVTPPHTGGFK